jgi:hypothetical protein
MAKMTLGQWVREACLDEDKGEKLTAIILVHMQGMQQQEIHTAKFGLSTTKTAEDVGAMLKKKAEEYCQDMPGVQMFQLLAFYGGRTEPEARHPFVINVNNHGENGLFTENPTTQGSLQQQMRHGEMLIQQVYRRQQAQDDYSMRLTNGFMEIVEGLSNRLEKALAGQMEATTIAMDLMTKQRDKEHEYAMQKLTFERQTAERKKWLAFAPPLINQLLGREVFPQSTEDSALVEQIADAIKPEDLTKLSGLLPPEMWGPLASRMQKHFEKKERETAETKALMPPVTDAAAEAAGRVQPTSLTVVDGGSGKRKR